MSDKSFLFGARFPLIEMFSDAFESFMEKIVWTRRDHSQTSLSNTCTKEILLYIKKTQKISSCFMIGRLCPRDFDVINVCASWLSWSWCQENRQYHCWRVDSCTLLTTCIVQNRLIHGVVWSRRLQKCIIHKFLHVQLWTVCIFMRRDSCSWVVCQKSRLTKLNRQYLKPVPNVRKDSSSCVSVAFLGRARL